MGPIRACPTYALQFSDMHGPADQWLQYRISKFAIPAVTFIQFAVQLHYPSPNLAQHRGKMLAFHGLACIGMALQFACSDIVMSLFPFAHETLRWGAHSAETYQVLLMVALVSADFWLLMPEFSVCMA